VVDAQLTSLSACLADDLLTLRNIHHGGVVDTTDLCNGHLQQTTWSMSDVALRGFFFGVVHSRAKWPERPQLKQVWPEEVPTVSGAGRRITGRDGGRALGATRWC
jgi:hypothetical protein